MGAKQGFYSWLLEQSDREDPIGDFAQDVKRLRDVSNDFDTKDKWLGYLRHKSACPEAIEAFEEGWLEFNQL